MRPRTEVGRNSFPTSPTFPVHGCPDGQKSVWARHTPLYPYFAAFTTRSDHNRAHFEFQKGSEGTGLIETQSPLNHYLPPNMPIPGNITVPETQNADAGLSPPKVPVKASVLTTLRPTSLPNNIPTHLPSVIRPPPLRTYLPTYLSTFLPTYLPTYLPSFPPCYLLTFLPSNLPSHP